MEDGIVSKAQVTTQEIDQNTWCRHFDARQISEDQGSCRQRPDADPVIAGDVDMGTEGCKSQQKTS